MLLVGLLALVGGIIYFLLFSNANISSKAQGDLYQIVGILVFIVIPVVCISIFDDEKYVSEILIYDESIVLVYKIKGKEVERKEISKNNIKNFKITTSANIVRLRKGSYTEVRNTINIKTKDEEIVFSATAENLLFGCPYQLILDLIKYSNNIPNFNYKTRGTDIYAKKDIEYYCQHGKRIPFIEQFKFSFNQTPEIGKMLTCILLAIVVVYFGFMAYFLMPVGKLSDTETKYISHYKNALSLTRENNYTKALYELSEAEKYCPNDPEIYLEKAYNYKKLKQYDKGILAIKEGLKYVNSKSISDKYYKIRFPNKKDIAMYTVLGEMYEKTKDYKNMKDSYDYVVSHVKYTYTDAYFKRGIAEYYLSEFNLALEDFLKHKEIIQKYIKDQEETKYKAYYPTYDSRDLDNIELWIQATREYGKL